MSKHLVAVAGVSIIFLFMFSQNVFGTAQKVIKISLEPYSKDARSDFCDVRVTYNESIIPSQIFYKNLEPYVVFLTPTTGDATYIIYSGSPNSNCPVYEDALYFSNEYPRGFRTSRKDSVYDYALNELFQSMESCYVLPAGVKKCIGYKSNNLRYSNIILGPVMDVSSIDFRDDVLEQRIFLENYGAGGITDFRVEYLLKNNVSTFCPINLKLTGFKDIPRVNEHSFNVCAQVYGLNKTILIATKNVDGRYIDLKSSNNSTLDFSYCINNTKINEKSVYESRFVFTNESNCSDLALAYSDITISPETIEEQKIEVFNFKMMSIIPDMPSYAEIGFKIIPNERYNGTSSLKVQYLSLSGNDTEIIPFGEKTRTYEFPQRTMRFKSSSLFYPFDSYETSLGLLENSYFKDETVVVDPLPNSFGLLKIEQTFKKNEVTLLIKRNAQGILLIVLAFSIYFVNFYYLYKNNIQSKTKIQDSRKKDHIQLIIAFSPFLFIFVPNMFPLFSLLSFFFFISLIFILWTTLKKH